MKFQSKDFEEMLQNNPELKEQLYEKICDKLVLKYDTELGIDDVLETEGEYDE